MSEDFLLSFLFSCQSLTSPIRFCFETCQEIQRSDELILIAPAITRRTKRLGTR